MRLVCGCVFERVCGCVGQGMCVTGRVDRRGCWDVCGDVVVGGVM